MRIVIDLQGAQSTNSRNRGIGRYSLALAQAIARNHGEHEVIVALGNLFPDTIQPLKRAFSDILPLENIKVWGAEESVAQFAEGSVARRQRAEAVREGFLGSLRPDIVLVTSLFEGLADDAVTSVGMLATFPTAVVLFDLIPLINRDVYLNTPLVDRWYDEKIEHLRRADLLLSISASSGREAVEHLDFDPDRVVNISTACGAHFHPRALSEIERQELMQKYGLQRSYLMYTGGIDHRKNIEGLIRAYALLPSNLRSQYQLAVICSVQETERDRLMQLACKSGLRPDELVMTGFVPEDDLVGLYNACTLFVFPSWHEGFGLPALEAMQCGKAVIAANTSSLPEVVGREDALFDPYDDRSIADKMTQVLTDASFRQDLERHGLEQSKKFSWDITARRAVAAMEHWHEKRPCCVLEIPESSSRPRMAYLSPLPPERSGISDYSAELLRVLVAWYDIEVIVDQPQISDEWVKANCRKRDMAWFEEHYASYDRVIYHFGNSTFHQHMFDFLAVCPGIVVLHDFYMSGVQAHRELQGWSPYAWTQALRQSHGYSAVKERLSASNLVEVIMSYPANLAVLQQAIGIITHSVYSLELAENWYGDVSSKDWAVIPLLRAPVKPRDRQEFRASLGLDKYSILICSFGLIDPTKLSHRLLDCFMRSSLAEDSRIHLVFVGDLPSGEYGLSMRDTIQRSGLGERIRITGWASAENYQAYLAAADIGVQLRGQSRGETSAAVLDCMNFGLATVVNANGSMNSLDESSVFMLPDHFDDQSLVSALEYLCFDLKAREELGARARSQIVEKHAPEICAAQYAEAIELMYDHDSNGLGGVVRTLSGGLLDKNESLRTARILAENFPPSPRLKQLFIDLSPIVQGEADSDFEKAVHNILKEWLLNPPAGWTVEPIYVTEDAPEYRYARGFTCRLLGIDETWAEDEVVDAWPGDVFLGLDLQHGVVLAQSPELESWRNRGVDIVTDGMSWLNAGGVPRLYLKE